MARIEQVTLVHSNFLGFVSRRDETWLNYRFHINGDRNREVKLAVLIFHFPEGSAAAEIGSEVYDTMEFKNQVGQGRRESEPER